MPTQAECKAKFVQACKEFAKTLEDIDKETPGDPGSTAFTLEPIWWVDMIKLERDTRNAIKTYETK